MGLIQIVPFFFVKTFLFSLKLIKNYLKIDSPSDL